MADPRSCPLAAPVKAALCRESLGVSRAEASEGQVKGLVDAERHALGVSPVGLLFAEARPDVVEAVLAIARFEFLPWFFRPV
jgi:hypothetical protein